jgi:hypothetical protein
LHRLQNSELEDEMAQTKDCFGRYEQEYLESGILNLIDDQGILISQNIE